MAAQTSYEVKKTSLPVVAGVFNIAVGSLWLLGVLIVAIIGVAALPFADEVSVAPALILLLIGIPIAVIGVLSLIGGIYGVQRRYWGWALAGSIASIFIFNVLGIVAVVLTAVSKNEFSR